jgi:FdhD protein
MTGPPGTGSVSTRRISVAGAAAAGTDLDAVAVEEPLEIRVLLPHAGGIDCHPISITMRTPGHDFELATGFLFTEGVLPGPEAVEDVSYAGESRTAERGNVVTVRLRPGTPFDAARLSRNVYTTSSCGVCGKTSLDMVRAACMQPPEGDFVIDADLLHALPARLRESQDVFRHTGGLHATALFDPQGDVLLLREDVGRHNAMDKVVGAALAAGSIPLSGSIALLSGRISFELVQKAVVAGIPFLAAVGAPTSLALDLAREFGVTLVGFLRERRCNLYCGEERVRLAKGIDP